MSKKEQEDQTIAFRKEAYAYVSAAQQLLSTLSNSSDLESFLDLTRKFKQGASDAHLLDIVDLAAQLENEITRLKSDSNDLTADGLKESQVFLVSYVDSIEQFLHFSFQRTGHAFTLEQLLKPEEYTQLNLQLLDAYKVEVQEHFDNISDVLAKLDAGKMKAPKALEAIYRAIHSIKGDSNALELTEIGSQAHILETRLDELVSLNQKKLTREQIEELFLAIGDLQNLAQKVLSGDTIPTSIEQVSDESQISEDQAVLEGFKDSDLDYLFEDTSILELYYQEAEEIIVSLREGVKHLQGNPQDTQLLSDLYRGAHTLKGNSFALGVELVGEYTKPLEELLSSLRESPSIDVDQLKSVEVLLKPVQILMSKIGQGLKAKQETSSSTSESLVDSSSSGQAVTEIDALEGFKDSDLDYLFEDTSILELYYQEAEEIIVSLRDGVKHLQDNPQDTQLLSDLYRGAHTLKGNSFALGVELVGEYTKPLEELLSSLRESPSIDVDQLKSVEVLLKPVQTLLSKIGQGLKAKQEAPVAQSKPSSQPAHVSTPSIVLDIPEEIRDIYMTEALELVESVEQNLLGIELQKISVKTGLDEVYRAMHTLKGNSFALGVEAAGELAHEFETKLETFRNEPQLFAANGCEVLFQALLPLQRLLGLSSSSSEGPTHVEYDSGLDDVPQEVRQIFIAEAQEILENISLQLMTLDQDPEALNSVLEEVYRLVHTLKGNANALGVNYLGGVAHELEDQLTILRDQPTQYTPATSSQLFKGIEDLRQQVDALTKHRFVDPSILRSTDAPSSKTADLANKRITQSRTPQQVIDSVRRDKALFEEFVSSHSSESRKIDSKSTGEYKTGQADQAQNAGAIEETIRVGVNKIDKLINLSDELLISKISFEQQLRQLREMSALIEGAQAQLRNQLDKASESQKEQLQPLKQALMQIENQSSSVVKELRRNNASYSLLIDEIQHQSRSTRMLPGSYLLNPLRLVIRNTSARLGKKVFMHVSGENIEMDRLLIERLKDPLAHLLRNALDHGVESPTERKKSGKLEEARITLAISLAGNMIRFQIHDDGRGINYQRIRDKAIRNGLSPEQVATMSEVDLHSLMFSPGFSTADQITDISGRGVGLDVVKSTLVSLNGNIEVSSIEGRGTLFTLMVPITLTTFEAFLVKIGQQMFALSRSAVLATLSVKAEDVSDNGVSKAIFYADQPVRLANLQHLLQIPGNSSQEEFAVLVVESGLQRVALSVDEVLESQQMVMKGLGSQLQRVPYVAGATLLGHGEPVVVLNLPEITNQVITSVADQMSVMVSSKALETSSDKTKSAKKRVLVVDDSVTTRTLEKNILEAAGFEVVIAKDGLEGKETVLREMPNLDLVITDVEMPKMTGYEFASWLKFESEYQNTPVIMVSSLATQELKAKGYASGINAYIVKGEFNQQTLLNTISELLITA